MSHVYVAESGDGYCKVGKSQYPEFRVKQIERDTGLKITKFKSFECGFNSLKYESKCHDELSELSVFGEWFNCDFDVACCVVSNIVKTYKPKNQRFNGKKQFMIGFTDDQIEYLKKG